MSFASVVNVIQNKCTNCHICILSCPIKYCFKDSKTATIVNELCIGCGRCYKACPHEAIGMQDDLSEFYTR